MPTVIEMDDGSKWTVVPVTPTDEMLHIHETEYVFEPSKEGYDAMLSAAPSFPADKMVSGLSVVILNETRLKCSKSVKVARAVIAALFKEG